MWIDYVMDVVAGGLVVTERTQDLKITIRFTFCDAFVLLI